jgi:hypothetical protein
MVLGKTAMDEFAYCELHLLRIPAALDERRVDPAGAPPLRSRPGSVGSP